MRIIRVSQAFGKKPWELTLKEYVNYHNTGHISESAYLGYKTVEGLDWIKRDKYKELYSTKDFGGKRIEFRKTGERNMYVNYDENDRIIRDKSGKAIYMSEDEIIARGLAFEDTTIVAFYNDKAIGFVSDEFGSDGVWVVDDFQRLGIGLYLLKEFRNNFNFDRKIGQMTNAGKNMTMSLHKSYVRDALVSGEDVSDEVLMDYPDLLRYKRKLEDSDLLELT